MSVMGTGNCDWAGIRYIYYFTPAAPGPSGGFPQIIRRIAYGHRPLRLVLEGSGVIARSSGTKAQG